MTGRALRFLFVAAIAWSATPASGQIRPGDLGMQLVTKAGAAGVLCRGFSCTTHQAVAGVNETVKLAIRGPLNAPFWLFVAPSAKLCASVPGFRNNLVLSPPLIFTVAGALSTRDRILACPGGLTELKFPIPLPIGARFSMQSIVMAAWLNGPQPTFSATIDVRVK